MLFRSVPRVHAQQHLRPVGCVDTARTRADPLAEVWDAEVVGLTSYMGEVEDGAVEIGYGVAPQRRGLGHATLAVAALVEGASR